MLSYLTLVYEGLEIERRSMADNSPQRGLIVPAAGVNIPVSLMFDYWIIGNSSQELFILRKLSSI